MTGKTTFLALFIVGLLVCPAAADSYSVTAPSSTIWALPGGSASFPVSILGSGSFDYADIGFQYNSGASVLQLFQHQRHEYRRLDCRLEPGGG